MDAQTVRQQHRDGESAIVQVEDGLPLKAVPEPGVAYAVGEAFGALCGDASGVFVFPTEEAAFAYRAARLKALPDLEVLVFRESGILEEEGVS